MSNRLRAMSRWVRANWIELVLSAVLLIALSWLYRTGRDLLAAETPLPTMTPIAEEVVVVVVDETGTPVSPTPTTSFSGQQALGYVAAQVALGPRPSGSNANQAAAAQIADELSRLGWTVETQEFDHDGVPMRNVLARAGSGSEAVLIATHFDTRPVADRDSDPARRADPTLGANGSASGVAVLLELARAIDRSLLGKQVWLAFLDGGDTEGLPGAPAGGAGAAHLAQTLVERPQEVIVISTVGGENQRFRYHPDAEPQLSERLWLLAARLGNAEWFIPETSQTPTPWTLPWQDWGRPRAAIFGDDYPYRHTTEDTPSRISAISLERVGALLEAYLEGYTP